MPIDGKYNLELKTTMGVLPMELTLKREGSSLSGGIDGHFGKQSFSGGKINGSEVTITLSLKSPMGGDMPLEVTAKVGDGSIEGQVRLSSFRPTPFTGKRISA